MVLSGSSSLIQTNQLLAVRRHASIAGKFGIQLPFSVILNFSHKTSASILNFFRLYCETVNQILYFLHHIQTFLPPSCMHPSVSHPYVSNVKLHMCYLTTLSHVGHTPLYGHFSVHIQQLIALARCLYASLLLVWTIFLLCCLIHTQHPNLLRLKHQFLFPQKALLSSSKYASLTFSIHQCLFSSAS